MLKDLNKSIGQDEDPENWKDTHSKVVSAAYEVIKLKGYTSWAIGLSLTEIVGAILNDANTVHPVTTCLKVRFLSKRSFTYYVNDLNYI